MLERMNCVCLLVAAGILWAVVLLLLLRISPWLPVFSAPLTTGSYLGRLSRGPNIRHLLGSMAFRIIALFRF